MTIVYLHGFASSGMSRKVTLLREQFTKVVSPDLPFDPDTVTKIVSDLVYDFYRNRDDTDRLIFVGTSLGGFYANYFGQLYDCPTVLVNPSCDPHLTLQSKLGINHNHSDNSEFTVTQEHLDKLEKMSSEVNVDHNGSLVNLFLAMDDDVIDYRRAVELYPYYASRVITKDGGHRYDQHWNMVMNKISQLIT